MHVFVARLLSIAVITSETYVQWTGWFITQLANKIKLCQCAARMLMHDSTVIWRLLSREPREYTHIPYIARNRVPAKHLRRWQCESIFTSLQATVFESHKLASSMYWRENRISQKMAIQGHSRWRVLWSVKNWQETPYQHIITLALSLMVPKM